MMDEVEISSLLNSLPDIYSGRMVTQDDYPTYFMSPKNRRFIYLEHLILQRSNVQVIEILNKDPTMINFANNIGQTLLFIATKHKNCTIMKHLIQSGCDINVKDNRSWTPLMVACTSTDPNPAKLLLHYDADIFIVNSQSESALQIYANQNSHEYTPVLNIFFDKLERRSVSHEDFYTNLEKAKCPLFAIVHLCNAVVTKMFLDQRNFIDDLESSESVFNCIKFNYLKNLKVLLQYGANVEFRRMTFFSYLGNIVRMHDINDKLFERMKIFIHFLADLKLTDQNTPIFVKQLFIQSSEKALQVILKSDLNTYIKTKLGYEPLVYIFGNSNVGILELIEREKIDVNIRGRSKESAIHIAFQKNVDKNIYYLLKKGINVNVVDDNGATSVYYALLMHEEDLPFNDRCLTLLLHHGLDVQVYDRMGYTFIEYVKYLDKCERVFTIILAHLALLPIREIPIEKSIVDMINSHEKLSKIHEQMCLQLELMKLHKIGTVLTLFTVLTNSSEFISHRMMSVDSNTIDKLFFDENHKLAEYDFYYIEVFRDRLLRADLIRKKRDEAQTLICDCIEILKPYYLVVEKICSFLTYDDMHNFEI